MNRAYFRLESDDNQLIINFRYKNPKFGIDRDFNFRRNVSENISICLERMRNNIEKEFLKKNKKKKDKKNTPNNSGQPEPPPKIDVQLLYEDQLVQERNTFQSLLTESQGNKIILRIAEEDYHVVYNKPWVAFVTLPSVILAGYHLYPNKLELLYADRKFCTGYWYKGKMPQSKDVTQIEWEEIGEGLNYITQNEDINHFIKFVIIPGNQNEFGPPYEIISKSEVEANPGPCPFESRHLFTQSFLSGDKFRVVSYNLLADYYTDNDYSRSVLFEYCPAYALHIDYRKQLFIKEIIGYNADILCLQEVDSKIFDWDLMPLLGERKYNGILNKKGLTAEGICVFYRTERFDLVRNLAINIGDNMAMLAEFVNLYLKIKDNGPVAERVRDLSTTVQIVVLRSKDNEKYLLVANTHLYFHPDADHIRLLQIGFSMLLVEKIYKELIDEFNLSNDKISILFCGDFNSVPECGIYKLMTENHVDEDFIDWSSNENEIVRNISLSQPYKFGSACGCPNYTNYTHLFSGCLDYIFYQKDNLIVDAVVPLPSDEEVKAHTAIPSVVFPSDHIALVADLKWKPKES